MAIHRPGTSGRHPRERTSMPYLDQERFRAALGLRGERKIILLLLDCERTILWRSQGSFDESKGQSLEPAPERLTHAPSSVRKIARCADLHRDRPRPALRNLLRNVVRQVPTGSRTAVSRAYNQPDSTIRNSTPGKLRNQLQPGEDGFVPLAAQQRASLFFKGYFGSPVPYSAWLAEAGGALIAGEPDGWGRNWNGYGKRVGTTFVLFTMEEAIHDTGDAALRLDPRYFRCRCSGVWQRSWHALKMTALAYDRDGQLHLDLPRFAGDYAASMIVTTWYPPHYSPLVQGVQMGHVQVGTDVGVNLLREFSPELKRIFQRFKLR